MTKSMLHFECDYLEGAHPKLLEMLLSTNMEQTVGYSEDSYCAQAFEKIRLACQAPQAAVHFLVGGTQTNTTVIASILRPYQGALCAKTGHIAVHETGAIEATGHKVLTLESHDGKITAAQVRDAYQAHVTDGSFEHIVQPGMVYISQPTETGLLYSRAELEEMSATCHELQLPLYIDGARLGYALAAPENDVYLPDLARLADIFYIGGTKVGALFGEAVVIPNLALQKDFRYMMKRQGGMLAKGRLLGLQFLALFTDDLYFKLGQNAIICASTLRQGVLSLGYELVYPNPTNQIFLKMSQTTIDALHSQIGFEVWERIDQHWAIVRFCTSWATQMSNVEALLTLLKKETQKQPHPIKMRTPIKSI